MSSEKSLMRIIEDTLLEEVENVAIAIDSAIADGIIKNENINLFSKINRYTSIREAIAIAVCVTVAFFIAALI